MTVLYTCDTTGHISPCNCETGVAGGLARRMTFVSKHRNANSLLVDAGNVTAGPREWELLELDYILRGYQQLGYDAVNLGAREVSIDATTLGSIVKRYPFLISANVADASGKLIAPPYRIVKQTSGYRIGIIGVVNDTLDESVRGKGVTLLATHEALARYVPELKKQSDFVVLLSFLDEPAMKSIAEQFFEIDAIIGGDVQQPSNTPLDVNRSTVAYITDKGKSIGQLEFSFIGGHKVVTNNAITKLDENFADDPAILKLVDDLKLKQVEKNYPTDKDDSEGLSTIAPPKQKDAPLHAP